MRWRSVILMVVLLVVVVVAGCAAPREQATPTPTRTMVPTFTPTPASSEPVAAVRPGEESQPVAAAPSTLIPPTPTPTSTPVPPTPTPTNTPTPTPTPKPEVVVQSQRLNVRAGPSTLHPRIGQVTQGDVLEVVGKNPDNTWWQVRLADGSVGWVYGGLVAAQGAIESVQVAANIPTPPPTPTPRPTPTPLPTPTPKPQYVYNKALLYGCEYNAGVTEVHGTVYFNQQYKNGARVVFSIQPDGPWITPPAITGPHEGYPDWPPGFYSHILQANGPRAGVWYFWIVDEAGRRISVIQEVRTDGVAEPGKCQKWTLDWDTN